MLNASENRVLFCFAISFWAANELSAAITKFCCLNQVDQWWLLSFDDIAAMQYSSAAPVGPSLSHSPKNGAGHCQNKKKPGKRQAKCGERRVLALQFAAASEWLVWRDVSSSWPCPDWGKVK